MKRLQGSNHLPDPRYAVVDPLTGMTSGIAYVAQTAWLQNATVRDNIIFGQPYDKSRYDKVIKACALVKDFETLGEGDLTEIGEKGINMRYGSLLLK